MATLKRKRTTTRAKPSKRPKYADSSDPEPAASEELWEAKSILDEKRVGRKLQYLIQWKGVDPTTGETYAPTWEPEENPTQDLVAAWKQKKAERSVASASTVAESSTPQSRPKKNSRPPRPSRKPRVIESSPEPSTAHTTSALSRPSTSAHESPAPAAPSSTVTTPIDATTPPKRPSPKIHVGHRGDSFDPDEFERFSQLPASQGLPTPQAPPSEPPHTQGTDLDSSQLFAALPEYRCSGIVPDSQSSVGAGSFIPTTQQTTGTTQQSSTVNESQEDVTEDSVRLRGPRVEVDLFANSNSQGLLEIVQQATSCAPSPARSIPETIYDTAAESQSQQRQLETQEHSEAPVPSDTIDNPPATVPEGLELAVEDSEEEQTEPSATAQVEERQQKDNQTSVEQVAPSSAEVEPHPSEVSTAQDSAQPKDQEQSVHEDQGPVPTVPPQEATSSSAVGAPIEQPVHSLYPQHLARIEHTTIKDSQPTKPDITPATEEPTISCADETSRSGDLEPSAVSQDITEASLPERSVPDEAAQFAFHSQQPQLDLSNPSPAQLPVSQPVPEEESISTVPGVSAVESDAVAPAEQVDAIPIELSATGPHQALNDYARASQPVGVSLVLSTQTEDQILLSEFLEPEYTRSRSITTAPQQTAVEVEPIVQLSYDPRSVEEETVLRRDFAIDWQVPQSTDQSISSREQNAQVVPPHHDLSTQEDTTESIRPSVEKEDPTDCATPDSRHDSSQDTPERRRSSVGHSSSAIAQPPSQSLGTLDSNVPLRLVTPIATSSLSIMATQGTGAEVGRQLQEMMTKAEATPFTPTPRLRRSNMTRPSATPGSAATPIPSMSRRLLQTRASPPDGTRSPSTVPDRSPAPPAPTSLRTIALTHASHAPAEGRREEPTKPPLEVVEDVANIVPVIVTTELTVPEEVSSDNEVLSDATDDDTESLINDELQLELEEWIVPLFIDGRQCDEYAKIINYHKELLKGFVHDRYGFEPFSEIEKLLSKLRAVETHYDLIFAEAGSSSNGLDGATQIEFTRDFGIDNSVKFKFLHSLIYTLREQRKHIVLVIDEDNDKLLKIIENFCKACFIQYNMPTREQQSDPLCVKGNLCITIFPSTLSPIIRPADVVICLDGVQDVKAIRQKNWATSSELEVVPILHLVVSRTIGHIERYLPSSLSKRDRAHTIVASLGQMIGQLGKPIDEDIPRAPATAQLVAGWLEATEYPRDWPLGSIGSVKDVIEFQTQMSQAATSPAPERTKRPHDDEVLDPAKRMRLTPQPQGAPNSSINNENEITRISDSMPGTALDNTATLRAQITRIEDMLERERAARKAEQSHYREQEIVWGKQQTAHEDLTREHRILLGKQQSSEEKVETLTKNNDTLRERLAARTTEMRNLTEQLDEQRNTHSLSDNAQIAEITKLRTELAQAVADKQRAAKSAATAESTLDYTKEQYRLAQDAATSSAASNTELTAQVAKLSHAASSQPAKLKALHLDRQYETQVAQIRSLKAENSILKKSLQTKEDELQRAKLSGGRMGVGTRATSVTPQPSKVRSRAGSPMTSRVSNLRNG